MHPQLILIAAQQRVADLHRAGDHGRLIDTATTATTATGSHAGPAPCHAAAAPVSSLRWVRRGVPQSCIRVHGRLEPREDQAGHCK